MSKKPTRKTASIIEIIRYLQSIDCIDLRVDQAVELSKLCPFFPQILEQAFEPKMTFIDVCVMSDQSHYDSLAHYDCTETAHFWKTVERYADSNTAIYADVKWKQLLASFEYMGKEESDFFWNLLNERFKEPKIDKVFYERLKAKL